VTVTKVVRVLTVIALLALTVSLSAPTAPAQGPMYSVWLVRNSVFKDVPAGAFMPDRVFVPGSTDPKNNQVFFQLPVNVGVIKGGNEVILYDTGWKQQDYLKMTNSVNWAPLPDQLKLLGIQPGDVTKIVIGHGHWDHAGTIMDFPNAILYVQKAELEGIEWALNFQGHPKISAVNVTQGGCMRSPACGFEPLTLQEIYGKILSGKAVIVDGMREIAPGIVIHPAHRAHTAGSQLLEVPTARGKLVFGSDVYSSWEGIRDWMIANPQQTDTVQQFLAYEKCYRITGGFENCVAAHEPLSYSDGYPLTKTWWVGPNDSRLAEVSLAPGERTRKP
jgi:glyoxylase-like metal-dependent hydrolase (beta-lactamase superfamily II)